MLPYIAYMDPMGIEVKDIYGSIYKNADHIAVVTWVYDALRYTVLQYQSHLDFHSDHQV